MQYTVQRFEDFHLHGASAPEWNQRYHQISSGAMSSSLLEVSFGQSHLFRKSLDRRVVQQGCPPSGQICFALPARVTAPARMQGREVSTNSLFVLRGGTEFTLHRPAGMELLAITFDSRRFEEFLDASGSCPPRHTLLSNPVLELPTGALLRFQQVLEDVLAACFDGRELDAQGSAATMLEVSVLGAIAVLLAELPSASHRPPRATSASFVVEASHRLALSAGGSPISIEEVCQHLRASRRTVQNSFQSVAQTTPLHYLRSIRLNAVRRQLLSTRGSHAGVGEIATSWGFAHLGHFAAQYKQLFGESPSATGRRAERLRRKR